MLTNTHQNQRWWSQHRQQIHHQQQQQQEVQEQWQWQQQGGSDGAERHSSEGKQVSNVTVISLKAKGGSVHAREM